MQVRKWPVYISSAGKWLLLFCIQYWTHTFLIHLCRNELFHGVWCSRQCWKDSRLVEDLHLCDSIACRAFPPLSTIHHPPSPPIFYVTVIKSERNDTSSVAKPQLACMPNMMLPATQTSCLKDSHTNFQIRVGISIEYFWDRLQFVCKNLCWKYHN